MRSRLDEARVKVRRKLESFLAEKKAQLAEINDWGVDVCDRLLSFSLGSKMLRGSLVVLAYELVNGPATDDVLRSALAIEFLNSGLLMQDDVMDDDDMRRGQAAIHVQYSDVGKKKGIVNHEKFGTSMSICAADMGFFWAFELLAGTHPRIIQDFGVEFSRVGLGQMHDVYLGHSKECPAPSEVIKMYRAKAARYTFALPLVTGARLAGASKEVCDQLERFGETVGIMFQIRDDQIGLYGASSRIGKPIGSDILEQKKTLYWVHFHEQASDLDKEVLRRIANKGALSSADLEKVRGLFESSGAFSAVNGKMAELERAAISIVEATELNQDQKNLLMWLVDYNKERTK